MSDFHNPTNESVFDELDGLLGQTASVHELAIRLGSGERGVRSALYSLRTQGRVLRYGTVWTSDKSLNVDDYGDRHTEEAS
mgnify:CR=1 FL=1